MSESNIITRKEIDKLQEDLKQGYGVPSHWYHDNNIFELEKKAIFEENWQYVCPGEKVKEANSCVAGRIADVPVIVARGKDGVLRGFLNMCKHRGHQILQEDGKKATLTCPYHAWSYSLEGNLRSVPECLESDGINKSKHSLTPIALHEWGGCVYGNLNTEAPSWNDSFPEFSDMLKVRKFDETGEGYSFLRRFEFDINANWKIWWDNHIECYHCSRIHGATFGAAFSTGPENRIPFEGDKFFSNYFPESESSDDSNSLRAKKYNSLTLFPGVLCLQQSDIMVASQTTPTGPETCRYTIDFYAEKTSNPTVVERWFDVYIQTYKEDIAAVEAVQRCMRTDRMPRNRLVPSQEPTVVSATRNLLDALRSKVD